MQLAYMLSQQNWDGFALHAKVESEKDMIEQ